MQYGVYDNFSSIVVGQLVGSPGWSCHRKRAMHALWQPSRPPEVDALPGELVSASLACFYRVERVTRVVPLARVNMTVAAQRGPTGSSGATKNHPDHHRSATAQRTLIKKRCLGSRCSSGVRTSLNMKKSFCVFSLFFVCFVLSFFLCLWFLFVCPFCFLCLFYIFA